MGFKPDERINPGDLNHRITIQAQNTTQDSFGQTVATWADVRSTWGGLNVVIMREVFGASEQIAKVTNIWTVRWTNTPILPGMQVVFGARVYRIQDVNSVRQQNRLVHLLTEEVNAGS